MSHNTLGNYYQLIWSLAQHHHYSISDIENSYPFERDIFVQLLNEYLTKLEQEREDH